MDGLGQPVASALRDTDAILSDDVEGAIHGHVASEQSFDTLGELLIASYVGVPDMIRELFSWCEVAKFDAQSVLRHSTKIVLKEHQHRVIDNLELVLLTSSVPHHLLRPLIVDPYWRQVALSIASEHPLSTFCYELNRENRLADSNLPVSIYKSPTSFSNALREMIQSVLSAPSISNKTITDLFNRIALVSTYDECVALVSLRMLGDLARNASSVFERVFAVNGMGYVRRAVVQTMRQSSYIREAHARWYVVHMNLLVDSVCVNAKVDEVLLNALQTLVLPVSTSGNGKRRHEKCMAILAATYGALLDDGVAGGCDDDDDEVVETGSEMDLSPAVKFVLVRALCYSEMRDDIAKALFTTQALGGCSSAGNNRKSKCYSMLLAYSFVAVRESDDSLRAKLVSTEEKAVLRKTVEKLARRAGVVAGLCHRLRAGSTRLKGTQRNMDILLSELKHGMIAHGALLWAEEGLHGRVNNDRMSAVAERSPVLNAKKYLAVLEAIAQCHNFLFDRVLKIMHEGFCRDFNKRVDENVVEDFRNYVIKRFASWVGLCMGIGVLMHFQNVWLLDSTMSSFHIRAFVHCVLQGIEQPCSSELMESLSAVLQHDRVMTAVGEDCKLSSLVLEFRKKALRFA